MARRPLIAGNWKMNVPLDESIELAKALASGLPADTQAEVAVFPTDLVVAGVVDAVADSSIEVGVQNIHWEPKGAFTGEISGELAAAAGAGWALVGHSERRQYFGETDETCNQRIRAALRAGLKPMLCIGETLEERDGGKLNDVLAAQVQGGLAGLSADELADLVIAYEPVWAIGTGRVASEEQAQEAHAITRDLLRAQIGDHADGVRLLYGGSAKPDNAAGLLSQPDIDGALVGGASLKADSFLGIIAHA